MSDFTPTEAQRLAINEKGRSLLVSAGAGSGKTKVLTERLLSRICDADAPEDIDRFLIITYTKAAASELRSRISGEISERLSADPDNRALRRQSALCRKAQIGTIHSFCQSILREYCHAAGLTPDFRIIEEERAEALRARVLEKVVESRYEGMDSDPGFRLLTDTVGRGRDDRRLVSLVLKLHSKMQSHARPDKWAEAQVERLRMDGVTDAADTVWGAELLGSVKYQARYWTQKTDELLSIAEEDENVFRAYGSSLEKSLEALTAFTEALELGWDAAKNALPIEFPRLGALKSELQTDESEYIKSVRDLCKKAAKEFETVLYGSSSGLIREMRASAPAAEALLALTLDFDRAFSAEKRRRGVLDFSDLEHMAARLLTDDAGRPTAIARELSSRCTEIMIDEYQDVNRVQETVFRAVSRGDNNLFMVGDVKQSIYRFRLADPGIFTEKYLSYADMDSVGEYSPARIVLQENFRSRREIINAVNHIFRCCMSKRLGELEYDRAAELKYGADYPGSVPVPELVLLQLPVKIKGEDDPEKDELEAAYVARRIRRLVTSKTQIYDKGMMRPLRWGDIAIIMRSANAVGDVYRRELTKLGIPVVSGQGRSFFASEEISFLMCLLAVIDNPHQDVPLISVLRFPCFGFSADELSQIRAADMDADFFDALCMTAEKSEKCAAFLETLSHFRALAPDITLAELLWHIYAELDLTAVCSAMTDGAMRRESLMHMIEYTKRFESTGSRGLRAFNEWLSRLAEKGADTAAADTCDGVQIMTVHKSKGLEFPVVFLCDTSRKFNSQDLRDTVLIHPELGLGAGITDTERGIEYPSLAKLAVSRRLKREMLSEEMRLLYVALTRAKERLIITGTLQNVANKLAELSNTADMPVEPEILAASADPLTWLIYAELTDSTGVLSMSIEEAVPNKRRRRSEDTSDIIEADPEMLSEIRRRLSWRYPFESESSLPSKLTATELKRFSEPDTESDYLIKPSGHSFRRPVLSDGEKPLTGAERGTATHTVLQFIDYAKTGSEAEIVSELERLRLGEYMTARQARAVDVRSLAKLFASPLGKRIREADKIYRELKFSLLCPAEDFFPVGEGEKLLLQGVIDCCLVEDGGLVIIDYKTDNVNGDELSDRAKHYEPQLSAYALAAQRMLGLPVKERILYFLKAGRQVRL